VESDDHLVPVFMPALVALLVNAEDKNGGPLTKDEVHKLRDNAACIMMQADDVHKMDESRGYRDIDPENCWHDWQMARREMGRKPDLDPGPRFNQVRSTDPAYQQTIQDAHDTIDQFRQMLNANGAPRSDALIKTRLADGDANAFMWLNNTTIEGDGFTSELFEVPDTLPNSNIGDRHTVSLDALLDWMVNMDGRLHGGFSLRYHRAGLSDPEKEDFDRHIGVTEYA
jgi:uncharacterized protein YegJ (DUF2314 family)